MILGIDPGKTSSAWAALEEDGTVKACGMFVTPISSLDWPHVDRMAPAYYRELAWLFHNYQPRAVAVERYQQRTGKGVGAAVENCNIEIGMILALAATKRVPVRLVMPAHWKAFLAGVTTGGKALESAASVLGINVTKMQTAVPITDHQCDSVGQGLWLLGRDKQGYEAKALVDRARASLQEIWAAGKK